MASCAALAKLFLGVFNVLLFVVGLIAFVFGILAVASKSILNDLISMIPGTEHISKIIDINELIISSATFFIALGAIVGIIGFLGCCGACCQVKWMLYLYLVLLVLIVLVEVAVIIVAVQFPSTFSKEAQKLMLKHLKENFKDCSIDAGTVECPVEVEAIAWNTLQYELKCCGAKDYKDYDTTSFDWHPRKVGALAPLTCCEIGGKTVYPPANSTLECYITGTDATDYYQQGCFDAILHWIVSSAIAIGVLAGLGALELILIVLTIVQLRNIASDSKK